MGSHGGFQGFRHLAETGDDLVDDKQISAFPVKPGVIEHRIPFSDSSQDIWDAEQVEQWRFVRSLGHGGFGHVYLEEKVYDRFRQCQNSQPQFRAVKIISDRIGDSNTKHHLSEILGMAKFSRFGASFIRLFAWFCLSSQICIAMEWAPYGDLVECISKPLAEIEVQEIVKQVTLGVVIMHERHFLHRDLKPRNIFVFRKRPDSPEWRVKLGDFGVSKRVRDPDITSWHTVIQADCSAPEVLGLLEGEYTEESNYANPVDMWSLGYVAHWLLTMQYPVTRFNLPRYCRTMKPLPFLELSNRGVSELSMDFIKNLLHLAPENRMNAQQAYSHPWLALSQKESLPFQGRPAISDSSQQAMQGNAPVYLKNSNQVLALTKHRPRKVNDESIKWFSFEYPVYPLGDKGIHNGSTEQHQGHHGVIQNMNSREAMIEVMARYFKSFSAERVALAYKSNEMGKSY